MNYNLKMEEQLKNIKDTPKLLLHACCAPCSSSVLERLSAYFEITIFFYNPNITDYEEYEKRLLEIEKFLKSFKTKNKVDIIRGDYEPQKFFEISKGLENVAERGKRCFKCYELRLKKTAEVAEKLNFDFFTTTLSLSPYKNATWINEIGEKLQDEYQTTFLYSDFKKKNGYKRSIELSKQFNLYRQDYCGCIYSKRK